MNPVLGLRSIARLRVEIGEFLEVGPVPNGRRRVIPISGGRVEGSELRGTVLALGADWNLVRADESETVSAHYVIRTDDEVLLSVQNDGVIADRLPGRLGITSLRIEAPAGSRYTWLNDATLVGSLTVDPAPTGIAVLLEYWVVEVGAEAEPRSTVGVRDA
ncbi:MAG: DUF3237 domain-containing protein [Actinomycetales bacterium]|nr:DUF3237 domain-containing protein [Actinomycetales bacterium]